AARDSDSGPRARRQPALRRPPTGRPGDPVPNLPRARMTRYGLLTPGSHRSAGSLDDAAFVRAMLQVEVAWARALARVGAIDGAVAAWVGQVAEGLEVDVHALAAQAEAVGNPV